jgi:SAM-dependent methyltransferase
VKIINPSVREDIEKNRPLRLDIGCGNICKKAFYGLDILEMEAVDIVADLNEPLDGLSDNSVIEIYSSHTFEHINNFFGLMSELYRIVRPDGRIEIVVPHFSYPLGYSDPTHVRFFGLYSMFYFAPSGNQMRRRVPNFYTNIKFNVCSVRIKFARDGLDKWFGSFMDFFVDLNDRTKAFYERHLCWHWPASKIVYVLKPDKRV